MIMDDKLSLSELQLVIRDSLYAALPGFYWIVAEISEIKENYAGHCYLELVEKLPDDVSVKARVKGIIWNKRYGFLKAFFENSTGGSLREGIKILIRVKIEYHEVYGLSLVINDIDPAFTLGEMALRRQQIIRRLEEEGVISMNRELDFPILPKRIAIISSKSAAGYSDFIKHLSGNSQGYTFQTALFEAVMQGTETEESVIRALDMISEHLTLFDAVVIIRGGGSQSDLSWFDNYRIAYHITQFPLPVITGIGHEKDMSVTDIVAWRAEKTPTAAADFLVSSLVNTEEYLIGLGTEISGLSLEAIKESINRLDSDRIRLIPVAQMMVSTEKERLSYKIISLANIARENIIREEFTPKNHATRLISAVRNLTVLTESNLVKAITDLRTNAVNMVRHFDTSVLSHQNNLNNLDPLNVLKRGYSVTSVNGRIVASVKMLNEGDLIKTQLSDGSVISKVIDK
jgi:exodeoxyribonuclease VII large subunit